MTTEARNFEIHRPSKSSGRAHFLDLECKLCHDVTSINLKETPGDPVDLAEKVADAHECVKKPRAKVEEPPKMDEAPPSVHTVSELPLRDRVKRPDNG